MRRPLRVQRSTSAQTVRPRARQLYGDALDESFRSGDRIFLWLACLQWIAAVIVVLVLPPSAGGSGDPHVWLATLGGAALSLPVILLVRFRPGRAITRHAIAVAQVLWSSVFIHLSGERIETHFHVFVSLAFLAFYRDWRIIVTASVVVALDHVARGVFGSSVHDPGWWRSLEYGLWIAFEDAALLVGIRQSRVFMWTLAQRQAELEDSRARVEIKVGERTRELAASREQYRMLLETTKSIPWELERHELRFRYVGPQLPELLGVPLEACLAHGFIATRIENRDREAVLLTLGPSGPSELDTNLLLRRSDGGRSWLRIIGSATQDGRMRGMMVDVTKTQELELQLRQAQKLESVGRLAAGVAHEINTPVQFVNDSVHFARDACTDLGPLLERLAELARAVAEGGARAEAGAELVRAHEELDVDYLVEAVPTALDRAVDGLGRIADIVRSMKEFAHPDLKEMRPVDINHALENTLIMARNEYKYVADVATDFGAIPLVACRGGEMNQVFLNIIVNAAHAIADVATDGARGKIGVRTRSDGECVEIAISDTGSGVPDAIRDKIFDPFFTTKEVGKGTGQGLAIARSVVVDKHGGELTFESEPGKGTTFYVRLPIESRARPALTQEFQRPTASVLAA